MDSPLPLHRLDQLPEARPVQRRRSRALKEEGPAFSPNGIAAAVTMAGALVASVLVVVLLY